MRHHVVGTLRFVLLGAVSGVLAGLASFVFLELLDAVTDERLQHGRLVWWLPLGGLVIGLAYHWFGGRAAGGTALAVSEAHAYTRGTPARMAPMVLAGTLLGHLFGASIGREGTAVQMSSSLTDAAARVGRLDHHHRAVLARAALAGGFGAVFGVPFAGVVFAMEIARRRTWSALAASVPAALVGHLVVVGLGHDHADRASVQVPFGFDTFLLLAIAGLSFGVAARWFAAAVPFIKRTMATAIPWAPLRPVIGGVVTLGLMMLVGRDYLGLSLPLLDTALEGVPRDWYDPILKFVFTVVALGTGFVGGEVTPLFVIGACLGSVVADPLGLPQPAMSALGLVAVFGAAAHVPLACTVMAGELFGVHAMVPALVVCLAARAVSRGDSIYAHPAAAMVAAEGTTAVRPGAAP